MHPTDEHYKLADELEKVLTPEYQSKLYRLMELEHILSIEDPNN